MLKEKFSYLRKLEQLEQKGVQLTKKYTMESSLMEMMGEYELLISEKEKENSIKFPVHFTITGCNEVLSILEFKEDIDSFYIPNHIYEKLETKKLEESGFTVSILLDTREYEKATSIVLKPFRSAI